MKKNELWRDRAGNVWEIMVVDESGPFPIMAKPLTDGLKGPHLFRRDGGFCQDEIPSPFDLAELVESVYIVSQRHRDELFDLTCAAMQGLIAGKCASPRDSLAQQAVDYAMVTHKEFCFRVRQ